MMDLSYRIATIKDASQIVELVNSAYRGDSSKQGWTTEVHLLGGQRTDVPAIIESIENPEQAFLLCFQRDSLIGSVQLEKESSNCYLGMFTVRPNLQGGGIGKQFMDAAQNFAKNNFKCQTLSISVLVQRVELISWYERRGFIKTGKTVPFPYGDERFGIPKRDDLIMIEMKKNL